MKHTEILHREGSIGGSISGEPFSTIPGDLIAELFNKEREQEDLSEQVSVQT